MGTLHTGGVPTTDWNPVLRGELAKPYWQQLQDYVAGERARFTVFPPEPDVFAALHLTPFATTRVVILGQDPYHGPGQAHGLCFSVRRGVPVPPSLQNIHKELEADLALEQALSTTRNSTIDSARQLIGALLPGGRCTADQVAQHLGALGGRAVVAQPEVVVVALLAVASTTALPAQSPGPAKAVVRDSVLAPPSSQPIVAKPPLPWSFVDAIGYGGLGFGVGG